MSNVDRELRNAKIKALILKRVFNDKKKTGLHKFTLNKDSCNQCNIKFWDWVVQNPDGSLGVGMLLCPVIGRDETMEWRIS